MSADNLAPGDPVIARGIDDDIDTVFIGNILGLPNNSPFAYYSNGNHGNVPVYAVEDRTTGEVRHYRGDFLTFDTSD